MGGGVSPFKEVPTPLYIYVTLSCFLKKIVLYQRLSLYVIAYRKTLRFIFKRL